MTFVSSNLIQAEIVNNSSASINRVWIASAYCKVRPFFEHVVKNTSQINDKILFVRWQLDDLVKGSSDLDVFSVAEDFGWKVYLNQRLHAKLYCFDQTVIIGSANLTHSGIEPSGNIECAVKCNFDNSISDWFKSLKLHSVLIDPELFQAISDDVNQQKSAETGEEFSPLQYSPFVNDLLSSRKQKGMFTVDLIWTEDPGEILKATKFTREQKHDMQLLGIEGNPNFENIKFAFRKSESFEWLKQQLLNGEIYSFGLLSHKLHKYLLDDPTPYRKTVKDLINNLLCWAETFANDLITQERTAHSTIVSKKYDENSTYSSLKVAEKKEEY